MNRFRTIAIIGIGLGIGLVAAVAIAWAIDTSDDDSPTLRAGDSVALDLEALAMQTFDDFVAAGPGVADCVGVLRLEAARELDELAAYDSTTATIVVRVPANAASLTESLVHEFAHHVEAVCPSHAALRPGFLAAQGRAASTPWFADGAWEDRPSEQFAEAVVEVVLDKRRRTQLRVRLTPEAVALVAGWLGPGGTDLG